LLDQVDAVTIAVPTPYHFEIASRCIERGIHVLIEKPIAETVAHAEALAAKADASGLVVQIGHIERFNPAYAELKHVLEEFTPLAVNFRRLSPYAGSNMDVDVVLDLMIHDVDLLLDLVGRSSLEVTASGVTAFSGSLDHSVACLRSASGPLVTLTASRLTEQKVRQIEVTALEAYIVADLLNKTISVHRSMVGEYVPHASRTVKYRQESVIESIHVPNTEPLFLELQHFVECVQKNGTPLVTAQHGAQALQLATQIRDTANAGLLSLATVRSLQMAPLTAEMEVA
jgi:predicted dehydrogenase